MKKILSQYILKKIFKKIVSLTDSLHCGPHHRHRVYAL